MTSPAGGRGSIPEPLHPQRLAVGSEKADESAPVSDRAAQSSSELAASPSSYSQIPMAASVTAPSLAETARVTKGRSVTLAGR
jgi:hypothetical protein